METFDEFIERFLARLLEVDKRGIKYNITIMGGRHSKETGADLPRTFNVQEVDPHR